MYVIILREGWEAMQARHAACDPSYLMPISRPTVTLIDCSCPRAKLYS